MWQQWTNGLLGLWVMIVPFLGMSQQSFSWTLIVTGLIVAVLGFWGAGRENSATHQARGHHMAMGGSR